MDYHKLLETLLLEKEGMLLTKDIIEAGGLFSYAKKNNLDNKD